jgi:hypothetical protein
MSQPARLLSLILVVVLGVAAVVATVVILGNGDGEPGPSAGPSGEASAPAVGSATAGPSQDVAAAFAAIEDQVRALRGLQAPDIGPPEIIDRAQLAVELDEMLAAEWTDAELADANLALRAMGLLNPDQDLRELSQALLADQVIGFYDPLEERMVVVSDEGLSVLARITYAHEYTHALQDAAFRSFDTREELTDDDAILARQALEEGDATVVMFQWALQELEPDELLEVQTTPQPDTSAVPGWMLRQLQFPYLAGFAFVNGLRATGDWAAVDAAYDDAPVSTEQVLHPEKYLDREAPVEVEAVPLAERMGAGWEAIEPNTIGEVMIDIWLVELGAEQEAATAAAAGWGGDRLAVAGGPDGAWAMAWRIAWDSAAEADEFAAVHDGLQPGGDIAATLVRTAPTETVVVHASSPDVLAAVVSAVNG